jgi:hypothetical protein
MHPKHQHLKNAGPSVQRRRTSIGAEGEVGKTLQVNEIGFIDVGDTCALVVCERRKVEPLIRGRSRETNPGRKLQKPSECSW